MAVDFPEGNGQPISPSSPASAHDASLGYFLYLTRLSQDSEDYLIIYQCPQDAITGTHMSITWYVKYLYSFLIYFLE